MSAVDVSSAAEVAGRPGGVVRAFRPDIEGLRAVAVVLVVLYHARVPWFAGGYVGVDVFYVISGFLITGLLLREHAGAGSISLRGFYARRARRLLPAAALVVVATAIASWFILPPLLMPGVALDAVSASGYAANIRFAAQATDYLAGQEASPLLHYWSLAVEEQFYLLWPLVMIGLLRARRTSAGIAAIGVASLVACVWLTGVAQPWAFFSLPTRAWQLAAGALLAVAAGRLARSPAAAGWLGLGLIIGAALAFDDATLYPGTAALVPVAGTALVLIAGLGGRRPGAPEVVLERAPFQVVGRLSYSIYLWHWPILILGAAAAGRPLTAGERAGAVAVTMLASAVTYRALEDPVRRARRMRRPRAAFAMAATVSLATIGGSFALAAGADDRLAAAGAPATPRGEPGPEPVTDRQPVPAGLTPSLARVRDDAPPSYGDGCHLPFAGVAPGECVYGDPGGARTVALVGDSHAAQWLPAFERLGREHSWRVISLTKSACPATFVTPHLARYARSYHECDAWHDAVVDRLRAERPDLVVAASNVATLEPGLRASSPSFTRAWRDGTERMLHALQGTADAVVVLGDTPRPAHDVPVCLSEHLSDVSACAFPVREPPTVGPERAAARAAGVPFLDPSAWVCPESPCVPIRGRVLIYRDHHHLTTVFAERLAPTLERALAGALGRAGDISG